ncbi:MAG: hypothetical protein GY701_20360 [Sulfitobacter sp.]|nr:hypothetical protein [Sulfitobacter sp.]
MKSWSRRADHEVARWSQALLLVVLGCFLLLLQTPATASATPTGSWPGEIQLDEHLRDAARASIEIKLTRGSDVHGDIGLLSMAEPLDLLSAPLLGDLVAISSGPRLVRQAYDSPTNYLPQDQQRPVRLALGSSELRVRCLLGSIRTL